ncbi:Protein ACCELERATED CELL DEATH 6, partial [Bienertia sinuspersici]
YYPALMEQANLNGDLPIHLVAKVGKLMNRPTFINKEDGNIRHQIICERRNNDGNTALHEAVLNSHDDIANDLFQKNKTAAYCLNKDKCCPLFLAIKNKNWNDSNLVRDMIIEKNGNEDFKNRLKDGKSIIHMAILTRKRGKCTFFILSFSYILKLIIDKAPHLVDSFDSRGRSPLSYATYIGYVEGVSLLLKHDANLEFQRDDDMDESFPIHHAAKGGQLEVTKLLTLSEILVKNNKQNALHVAAESGRLRVVKYLLMQPKFKGTLNTGDDNGNTPLHLAVKGFHFWAFIAMYSIKEDGMCQNCGKPGYSTEK